ncbi:hypothetical protein BDF14DRAFT_1886263 [Spinellus fusiger]|nr:hypothetical protein BDF14DRAFT_1886263 [Spinellus fusiger]
MKFITSSALLVLTVAALLPSTLAQSSEWVAEGSADSLDAISYAAQKAVPAKPVTTTAAAATTTTSAAPTKTTSTAPTATSPVNSKNPLVKLNSQTDFCFFLPPGPKVDIATHEDFGVAYCTKAGIVPNAKTFPAGLITVAHYQKTATYVQVTGYMDTTKFQFLPGDEGGQYDNHGQGKPVGAQCSGYNFFVNVVEPADSRWCIRCCQNKVDCNTGRSGYGCMRVVPGDYTGNTHVNNVLAEISQTPEVAGTDATANAEQEADVKALLEEAIQYANDHPDLVSIQEEWKQLTVSLKHSYPDMQSTLDSVTTITSGYTTVEQWKSFFLVLQTKLANTDQQHTNSDDVESVDTTTDATTATTDATTDATTATTDATTDAAAPVTAAGGANDYVTKAELEEEITELKEEFNLAH